MNNASENNRKELSLFLIGNKIDKSNRVVSKEKAEEIAHSFGMKYFELSCKINMNINEAISKMIIECHTKIIYINNSFIEPNFYNKLNKYYDF